MTAATVAVPPAGVRVADGPAALLADADLVGSAARAAVDALVGDVHVGDMYDRRGAEVYHDFTARDTSELVEIARVVRETSGPVLELAAGCGRITFALLGLGRPIVAVDLSPDMLDLLRDRLAALPARLRDLCRPVQADMTELVLDRPVGAVVLGTTSVSLLDAPGRARVMDRIRQNLRPDGLAVLTTVQPSRADDDLRERRLDVTGASGRHYDAYDVVAADRRSRVTVVVAPRRHPDEPHVVCLSRIRIVTPATLTAELRSAGLVVDRTVVLPGDRYESVVVVARRAA